MTKKAQVTIYIILGFVILIGVGLLFFFEKKTTESDIKTEIPGTVKFSGQEELRNFVDSCLQDAALNGIEILRLQAGHIDVPSSIPATRIKDPQNKQVVEQNGIKKVVIDASGNGNIVPYWIDSDNRMFVPTQEIVQYNLARYVEKSMKACVDEFNSFKKQGYTVTAEEPSSQVEFSNEVLIRLKYPIQFEKEDVQFNEEEFILRVPVNIKKALDLQTDVVLGEYIGAYLESNIKYLLSLYSYPGGDKKEHHLPPLTLTDPNTDCKMVTWTLSEAKEKVMKNVKDNAKYFKIQGEGDLLSEKDKAKLGVYKGFTIDLLTTPYENTKVDFEVNDDNTYFDVTPRSGETIRPHRHTATGIRFLPLFCSMRYQFKYTIKFPMMSKVTVLDSPAIDVAKKSLDKTKTFEFSAPIGINLCGNQNRECTGKPDYLLQDMKFDESKFNFTMPVKTLFCEEKMKLSQPIRVRAVNSHNFTPVESAAIFYKCGSTDECIIDTTDKNGFINSKFPLCENGELYVIKDDYGESKQLLSTYSGTDILNIDYPIEPLKELDVEIRTIDLATFMGNYYLTQGFTQNRCTKENIKIDDGVIAAKKVTDESILVSSGYGPSQVALVYPEGKKAKLSSGTYSLNYISQGKVKVTPSEFDVDGVKQSISMNKDGGAYEGMYILGNYNDYRVKFTQDEIKAARKIVFYVPHEISSRTFGAIDIAGSIVQADGSLYKKGVIDDDCDPSTEAKEVEIRVSKRDFEQFTRPRLE